MINSFQEVQWMRRALEIAQFGQGAVSPNPMVGCVLVHNEQLIGEGWHRKYGSWHAEVNAVQDAVDRGNENLIADAVAYVTLEPCAHTGNTPPCADLLIERKVKKVVICNEDPNPKVDGRGIEKMRAAGIIVETGVCEREGRWLNRRFFTFFEKKRPYIILKWAQTADGFIDSHQGTPLKISGRLSDMHVHKWRAEEDGILVGTNTAIQDNPRLNVRLWPGQNPVRIILDRNLKLSEDAHAYDGTQPTLIYNYLQSSPVGNTPVRYLKEHSSLGFRKLERGADEISQLLNDLHQLKIQSIIVEGGTRIINTFQESGYWDEIRCCQGDFSIKTGVKAPEVQGVIFDSFRKNANQWLLFRNPHNTE